MSTRSQMPIYLLPAELPTSLCHERSTHSWLFSIISLSFQNCRAAHPPGELLWYLLPTETIVKPNNHRDSLIHGAYFQNTWRDWSIDSFVQLAGFFPVFCHSLGHSLRIPVFWGSTWGRWLASRVFVFLTFLNLDLPFLTSRTILLCPALAHLPDLIGTFSHSIPDLLQVCERSRGGCTCLCRCPSGIWNLCTYGRNLDGQQSFKRTKKQKKLA